MREKLDRNGIKSSRLMQNFLTKKLYDPINLTPESSISRSINVY